MNSNDRFGVIGVQENVFATSDICDDEPKHIDNHHGYC